MRFLQNNNNLPIFSQQKFNTTTKEDENTFLIYMEDKIMTPTQKTKKGKQRGNRDERR